MRPSSTLVPALLALVAALAPAACALPFDVTEGDGPTAEDLVDVGSNAIVNGKAADAHEEAALLDIQIDKDRWASCSGALVAPRVVLTAGHCIAGFSRFRVTLPYAKDARERAPVESTSAAVFDYPAGGGTVVRTKHDVGLVFLDRPITLERYPVLATAPVADGSLVVNVGRKRNGQNVGQQLFASKPVAVQDAAFRGSPRAYTAERVIEKGDSGGPAELHDTSPPVIVGVASGTGQGYQLIARVDLLSAWIEEQIARYGGHALAVEGPCVGDAEVEPNAYARQATSLRGASCGELTANDVDWFGFRSEEAGARYSVRLAGGDAQVRMWKQVGKFWQRVENETPTAIDEVATGPSRYVLEVRSPSGAPGAYKLTLAR